MKLQVSMSMESVIGTILAKLRKIDVDYNTTIPSRQRMRTSKFNPKNSLQSTTTCQTYPIILTRVKN